jgi:hypothetical protein
MFAAKYKTVTILKIELVKFFIFSPLSVVFPRANIEFNFPIVHAEKMERLVHKMG